ncbi:MAG: response regulator transcription factor [Burkholderiales bacterium]|nr:response regulator transcription factor [Burkholderiales bacterium]
MTERSKLTVLIVDDEPLARMRLRSLVETCTEPPALVAGEAGDADTALVLLGQSPVDVVLLDIAMPGRDGLKLADELRRQPAAPMVVFVTAHGEHALRAFEVDAADYLTKPVRRERLQAALLRVDERRGQRGEVAPAGPMLVVSDRGRVLRVPAAEVLYLKAEQKYVSLCSLRGRWVLDDPLTELEQRLGEGFLRVHRNAVVALAAVRALERRGEDDGEEGWAVQVSNGDWLAVSRRQLAAVREAVKVAAAKQGA